MASWIKYSLSPPITDSGNVYAPGPVQEGGVEAGTTPGTRRWVTAGLHGPRPLGELTLVLVVLYLESPPFG